MEENINKEIKTTDNGITDASIERAKNAKITTTRIIKLLAKQKFKFLVILNSVIISSSLTIAAPLVMGKAIDQIYNGIKASVKTGVKFDVNVTTMGEIIGILLIIYVLTSLFKYFEQYIMSGIAQNLTLSLRKDLNKKLNCLPLK